MSENSPEPSDPLLLAQRLWEQGQQQAAIDRLLEHINAARPAIPRRLGLQLVYYIFQLGDLPGAELFLRRLLQVHPEDLEILENLAAVLSRQRKAADAISILEQVVARSPGSANAWDGLAASLARLKRFAEARAAGERSLALKTEAGRPLPGWQPPAGTPQQYLERPGRQQQRDVIAFSIWGSNPRYLRGALRNALLIPDLYPGWQARFHLDTTVPLEFRVLLQSLGAEVQLMPASQSLRQKLCWRFHAANDPAVGRFLVRDCDSVVNQREVAAVQQWLASERWFHVMRDWWSHTDPILAGMWGGVAGVLPDLAALLSAYKPPAKETANVDQWFLRDLLWGSIRPLALVHDRCFRSEGSVPWPTPTPSDTSHVGQDEFAANRKGQSLWLAGWLQRYPCLQVEGEDPFALISTSQEPPEALVLVRWHKPLVFDPKPAMPQSVTGRIMNLDRATHRWACMAHQLETLGWVSTHQRFAAKEATIDEAKAVGLPSAGYLGLWRTTISLLEEWLADQASSNEFLHLVEDDAVLHPSLPLAIEPLKSHQGMIDIVFTESFLTVPLYQRFRSLDKQRQHTNGGIMFMNGGQYLACTSSFILTRRGAKRLLEAMRGIEPSGRVPINDMFYRQLIREGKLSAAITLPFLSTIAPLKDSAIQTYRDPRVSLSMHVDLTLRRLLYFQAWEPQKCSEVLNQLAELLSVALASDDLETQILELIKAARSRGWLKSY